MSELAWVAVPGGRIEVTGSGEQRALLRVLVVPRLGDESDSTLADQGIADWPRTLTAARFTISLRRAGDVGARAVSATRRDQVQPGVWQAFFKPETVVRAWSQPSYDTDPEVDPTTRHAARIARTYEQAAHDHALPSTNGGAVPDHRHRLADFLTDDDPPVRRAAAGRKRIRQGRPPDFHRAVSLLREHPAVLRAMGLIFELTFDADELAVTTDGPAGEVSVGWPGGFLPLSSPWTSFEYDGHLFLPASTDSITKGMVDLSGAALSGGEPAQWEVTSVDVDSGHGRLRDAARAAVADTQGTPAQLPALRSGGLTLLRRDRAADFRRRGRNARSNAARPSVTDGRALDADNLLLGYRVDILPLGQKSGWFSLCERLSTYEVGDDPSQRLVIGNVGEPEEGHVKAYSAVIEGAEEVLRADEAVLRWSGWSLVVPKPTFDGHPPPPPPADPVPMPYTFRWRFDLAPKRLPALRFGQSYHIRIRAADIAGGGFSLEDRPEGDAVATTPMAYTRHEPVPSPRVPAPEGLLDRDGRVVAGALGPGGEITQLVIRSDRDLTVAQFAEGHSYPGNDQRILLPPTGSVELAEQHGKFDEVDDERSFAWIQRAMPPADPPTPAGEPPVTAGLPDPASGGVTVHLRAEVGVLPEALTISQVWSGTWPDLAAKPLLLEEGREGDPPTFESTTSVPQGLSVRLAKAQQITLELSSLMTVGSLDQFALSSWLNTLPTDPPGPVTPDEAQAIARQGRNPMVTPATVMNLVHAVRRPLKDPKGPLLPVRKDGQTFAVLSHVDQPRLNVDPNSTVQLDVHAEWAECDPWAEFDPSSARRVSQLVRSVTINRGDTTLPELVHEFGDTKHREVTYELTAVSRFRQFFDDEDPEVFLARTPLAPVHVLSSARPAPLQILSTVPAFRWDEDEPAEDWETLERTRLGGRLRIELAGPWYGTGRGEKLGVVVATSGTPPVDLRPFLTQVGRDPIWPGSSVAPISPDPDRWPTHHVFSSAPTGPATKRLAENKKLITVVPHNVWVKNRRWYADIELSGVAASSYCPFVQLAVARYQPDSVEDLELSTVVRTELVQLLPHRKLLVRRTDDAVIVTLEGLGPSGDQPNRVDVALERCARPPGMAVADVELTRLGQDGDDIPAWVRVPGFAASGVLNHALPPLRLPPDPDGQAGPYRVYVRETEQVTLDPRPGSPVPAPEELTQRTVFLDTVLLPSMAPFG